MENITGLHTTRNYDGPDGLAVKSDSFVRMTMGTAAISRITRTKTGHFFAQQKAVRTG